MPINGDLTHRRKGRQVFFFAFLAALREPTFSMEKTQC